MKPHPLYQTVKRALTREPATTRDIATELDADPDATRIALEQLATRGKARHCGHPTAMARMWVKL